MDHFLQSKYWREIKERAGNKTYEFSNGWFQTTNLPLGFKVGYVPKVDITSLNFKDLYDKAKAAGCSYVTIDPDNYSESVDSLRFVDKSLKLEKTKAIQLQNNVEVNLEKPEEELWSELKKDNRNYVRKAEKNNVVVEISNTEDSFKDFLMIYLETKKRHNFPGRGEEYLKIVWNTLKEFEKADNTGLVQIVTAYYEKMPLVSWMLITYEDKVYYPYGGSLDLHREVAPAYKIAWEILKWSKSNGYKTFDYMGIEEDYEKSGFSMFKTGFGGRIVKYSDSVNLIIKPINYSLLKLGMKFRKIA